MKLYRFSDAEIKAEPKTVKIVIFNNIVVCRPVYCLGISFVGRINHAVNYLNCMFFCICNTQLVFVAGMCMISTQ